MGVMMMTKTTTTKMTTATRQLRTMATLCGAFLLLIGSTGCVERTISITSDPEGALVYLNDEEIGRTPCRVKFLHYGTYDVRLVKEGYEPLHEPAEAEVPLYDLPGPDFFAEALPLKFHSQIEWHFEMTPVREDPEAMINRGRQMRARLDPIEQVSAADEPVSDAP